MRTALKLLPLVFVRPGALTKAEWKDIDLEQAMWTIPAHAKKQRAALKQDPDRVHLVPFSRQAVAILQDLYPLTGSGRFIFTGLRTTPSSKGERHMASEPC